MCCRHIHMSQCVFSSISGCMQLPFAEGVWRKRMRSLITDTDGVELTITDKESRKHAASIESLTKDFGLHL